MSDGLAALLPVRLPVPRPWTPSGHSSNFPRSENSSHLQIGVDLTPISKFRRVFEGRQTLLAEVFTEEELRYCRRQRRPFQHLAARYAAKEAVFKGLQTGLTDPLRWRDVEIERGPWGEPRLILRGATARLAAARGFGRCAVSLTHAADYALATVLFSV
jgi:holo-[acyl-carrier protein] synthase